MRASPDESPHSRVPSAAALITHLAQQFSGFEDVETYEGVPVTYMRKAQALVLDLHARFAAKDARFAFSDINALTGDSGGSGTNRLHLKSFVELRLFRRISNNRCWIELPT